MTDILKDVEVAPLAGAWIEIDISEFLKSLDGVAPLAGAWIEIQIEAFQNYQQNLSLPSRERGLKYLMNDCKKFLL